MEILCFQIEEEEEILWLHFKFSHVARLYEFTVSCNLNGTFLQQAEKRNTAAARTETYRCVLTLEFRLRKLVNSPRTSSVQLRRKKEEVR